MVQVSPDAELLTPRWHSLRSHAGQHRFWSSTARFDVLECTRRGGKSELFKRKGIDEVLTHFERDSEPGLYVYAAPTFRQVKAIYWEDLLRLSPAWAVKASNVSELWIDYFTGARIQLFGMDKPARVEGQRIKRFFCDEFHAWKRGVFDTNIMPAMGTIGVNARCAIAGVSRFSPDFKRLCDQAKSGNKDWAYHSWTAIGLLDEEFLDSARKTMDPRVFAQEFMAQRQEFQGLIYYCFDRHDHGRDPVAQFYDRRAPINFEFDFNVSPGIANVSQRMRFRAEIGDRQTYSLGARSDRPEVADVIDGYIGEVWIPDASNTDRVCNRLIADWGSHEGIVRLWGDPSGGSRKTSASNNDTDWSIIIRAMSNHFGRDRVEVCVAKADPGVRARVNAMNARLRSADGLIHTLFDPSRCPNLLDDFEQTRVLEGSAGEIDDSDKMRTHMTDAASYRAAQEARKNVSAMQEL